MFEELADGVFRRHYEFLRLNIGVVVGGEGVAIIDTRESHVAGRELRADVAKLTDLPIRWIVNTHHHWDHSFGNAVFEGAEIIGHHRCRARLLDDPEESREDARGWMPAERLGEIDEVRVTPPTSSFEALHSIDLGDRTVELRHHGRAHTDNDIVAHAGGVSFMGDLVEQGSPPVMGDGYPLEWHHTLAAAEGEARSVIVPGHGEPGDRDWLAAQRDDMAQVAARLEDVLLRGRALDDAAASGPFPLPAMREALVRGIELATTDAT